MDNPVYPRVTIGLPVYNGESTLQACLENLESQTFKDFQVIIRDNASSDKTSEIAQRFTKDDPRFRYIRNIKNVGPAQNFIDALESANTKYFLWRADDDSSATNYLERLIANLDDNPGAVLSVANIESRRPSRGKIKRYPYISDWPGPKLINIARQMKHSHASWIYGVWRTDYIKTRFPLILSQYPKVWAADHLVLLGPILDRTIVGDEKSEFIQRIGVRNASDAPSLTAPQSQNRGRKNDNRMHHMLETRALFLSVCKQEIYKRDFKFYEKLIISLISHHYTKKRTGTSNIRLLKEFLT